jgi:hypothetical protein
LLIADSIARTRIVARYPIDHQIAALDSEQCNQQSTAGAINNQQLTINNQQSR